MLPVNIAVIRRDLNTDISRKILPRKKQQQTVKYNPFHSDEFYHAW